MCCNINKKLAQPTLGNGNVKYTVVQYSCGLDYMWTQPMFILNQ